MPRGTAAPNPKLIVGCDRRLTIEDLIRTTSPLVLAGRAVTLGSAVSRDLDRGAAGSRMIGTTGIRQGIRLRIMRRLHAAAALDRRDMMLSMFVGR